MATNEINAEIDVDAEFERFVSSPHGCPEAFSLLNDGDAASAFKLCFAHGCVVGAKIVRDAAEEALVKQGQVALLREAATLAARAKSPAQDTATQGGGQ